MGFSLTENVREWVSHPCRVIFATGMGFFRTLQLYFLISYTTPQPV